MTRLLSLDLRERVVASVLGARAADLWRSGLVLQSRQW